MSELALKLIEECKRTKATTLDLSFCGMTEIPQQLTELSWLKELFIGGKKYYDLRLHKTFKTSNQGGNNKFFRLPNGFENLNQLEQLSIAGDGEQRLDFNDVLPIGKLSSLHFLSICNTTTWNLEGLGKSINLKTLMLDSNYIQELTELQRLKALEYLTLEKNQVTDIEPLSKLITLKILNLSINKLDNLNGLQKLGNLNSLHFTNNQINDLKPLINLTELRLLDFSHNTITDIQPLYKLEKLEELMFSSNQVKNLLPIKNCNQLTYLSFRKNQIVSLEPIQHFKKLDRLHINSNPIKYIEPIALLSSLISFSCKECPITDCPADVYESGDPKMLRAHFEAKKSEQLSTAPQVVPAFKTIATTTPSTEKPDERRDVKLIILGNSNAGKTNLVRYLETAGYKGQRNSTHGLEVHRWLPPEDRFPQLKNVAVSIWDFGGQEYYHDAYRLFLSDNAVYLLLWCNESNQNRRQKTLLNDGKTAEELEHFELRYWLDTVKHYSGTRSNTVLVTVQNKVDDPGKEKGDPNFYKKRIDQDLHEQYGISESYHISLQEGSKVENSRQYNALQNFLYDLQFTVNARADKETPALHWQQIRNAIASLKENTDTSNPFEKAIQQQLWITLADLENACKCLLTKPLTENEVYSVPRWLEKGGTVVYFPHIDALSDKIFLRPDLLAEKLYEVLDKEVHAKGGEFSEADIMKDKNAELKTILLQLALQLNLIFPHPDKKKRATGHFIAPQYLPENHPIEDLFKIAARDAWKAGIWVKVPLFFYKKILHGLLLYYAADAATECRYYWKHGIMFMTKATDTKPGVRVLIKGVYPTQCESDATLLIGVEQNEAAAQELQKAIFEKLLHIMQGKPTTPIQQQHATMNADMSSASSSMEMLSSGSAASATEPIVEIQVSYDGENFVQYNNLLETVKAGEPKVEALSNVWLSVQPFAPILPVTPVGAKKVFLSYSHQNTAWLTRLRTHLAGLRRAKEIETWDDKEILPGDLWDASIKKKLEEADVFILLLSADFIASEYIWKEELSAALKKYRERNAVIIPILFEPLDLGSIPGISTTDDRMGFKIGDFEIIPKTESGYLQAVSLWQNKEEALSKVAERIRQAIKNRFVPLSEL